MSTGTDTDSIESDRPLAGLLWPYVRPRAGHYGAGLVTMLLARVPQRAPEVLIGVALDAVLYPGGTYSLPLVPQTVIPSGRLEQLWFTAGLLAGAVVLANFLDWASNWLTMRASLETVHDLRTDAYEATTALGMGYFDDRGSGDLTSVVFDDVNNVAGVVSAAKQAVLHVSRVVVTFAFMALLHWQLALAVLAVPVVIGVASRLYARALEPRYERVRENVGAINASVEDALSGIRTVKAFTGESKERARVGESSRAFRESKWETIRLKVGFDISTWTVNSVGTKTLFLLGGYWVLKGPPLFFTGPLTAGTLLTFMLYTTNLFGPVKEVLVEVIDRYEDSLASAKRVREVLDHPDATTADDAPDLDVTDGTVTFEDVSFTYESGADPAVSDVSFETEPGELVGVVGSTGAGKSTLLKLLLRFYDPDSGRVAVDGQDVTTVNRQSLREAVGYVSQDPVLFNDTVRENVAYADPDADDESVEAAAKLAGAHEFVVDLPEGYDTTVGERGVKLSGGQRQRIAIARALYRDPAILILDEATSHVDNETELRIQESLASLAGERTTFAIAHRLSTVRNADRILVVDDGELVGEGTHEELLDRDGVYADLWRVQVGDLDAVSEAFLDRVADEARADGGQSGGARVDGGPCGAVSGSEEVGR